MLSRFALVLLILSSPALADGDEIAPVPIAAMIGHPYRGDDTPSRIHFINVRTEPVQVVWIAFDGSERPYTTLNPGQEYVQPTYVGHRWLVKVRDSGEPVEAFISTRSGIRDCGTAQIAVIR